MTTDVCTLLERAERELVTGDFNFYETARSAWRACRCAELADALDTLARTHGRPPIAEPSPRRGPIPLEITRRARAR